MFGVSFLEIAVIGLIALLVVGPQKLPAMMRTAGEWVGKLRKMTSDMRRQTGIDDILREEGIDGVAELRTLLRGSGLRSAALGLGGRAMASGGRASVPVQYTEAPDPLLEFPVEGVDAAGALPDDLFAEGAEASTLTPIDGSSPSPLPGQAPRPDSSDHVPRQDPAAAPIHSSTARSTPNPDPPGDAPQQK